MANGGFSFRFDPSQISRMLDNFEGKAQIAFDMYAETAAEKMQNYAKQNRPWSDRTGQARQRLRGYTGHIANGKRIYIAHGVEYGVFLEFANERKYAVLEQTVEVVGAEIMPGFERLLERLGG